MICPKCGSRNFTVSRERAVFGRGKDELVAACTCGKRLYGTQVEAEHKVQLDVWQKEQHSKPTAPTEPADTGFDEQAWIAHFAGLAKANLASLKPVVQEAVAHRERVDNLWKTLGLPHKNDEPGRKRNLINLEVATIERLYEESVEAARILGLTKRGALIQRHHKAILAKGEELHEHAVRIPFYADQACEAAQAMVSLEPTTLCTRPECNAVALEGRKYCGDDCRIQVARDRYTARQRAKAHPSTVPKPKTTKPKTTKPVTNGYDTMSQSGLMDTNLQLLRKYARNKLGIIGASKIRGGKPALVARILEVRGQ
jgi:hypothetical protein